MKKIFSTFFALGLTAAVAFAQASGPELLKDKSNFAKTELFEPESVFADVQTNLDAIGAYEKNPAAYKDDELLPIAICYLTLRNVDKTKELIEKFLKVKPDNLRALRTYGTILLLSGNREEAFKYYEKAAAMGDIESVKSMASACIISNAVKDMGPYVDRLKPLAKEDMQTANMLLIYAYRDPKARDTSFAKNIIASFDIPKILASATPDSLATALNLYLGEKSVWTPASLIIPARAAALGGHWGVARQAYDELLSADPKNAMALRGKAIVEYNLGGIMDAANLIMKAIKNGDTAAVNDAMELVVVTSKRNKEQSDKIYAMFKSYFAKAEFTPQVRLTMLASAINMDSQADIFFAALTGKGSEVLLKEPQLKDAITKGIAKYEGDMRSFDLKKRFEEASK